MSNKIQTTNANRMTLSDMRKLVRYAAYCRNESEVEGLTAQELLDIYHANVVWDGMDAALPTVLSDGTLIY